MTAFIDWVDRTSTQLVALFGWMTPNVAALVVLVLMAICAVMAHDLLAYMLRRILRGRSPYLQSVLEQTHNLTRTAFFLVAVALVLPALPLGEDARTFTSHLLLLAFIGLLGWFAMSALSMSATLYLRRFHLGTADDFIARKHVTQVRILQRATATLVLILTIGAALMTFDSVRQFGVSLFASAGVAGIVAGLAARSVLSNLFAGLQLAIAQPVRLDDQIMVEGEFGTVEEITSTYVVIKLWDLRRLVVPLSYFIEKPFQNWTREGTALVGGVLLYLDYTAPIGVIRRQAETIVRASPLWNGGTCKIQVTDAKPDTIELRILVSADSAGVLGDLRAEVREKVIDFLQREHPGALPRQRTEAFAAATPPVGPQARGAERASPPSSPGRPESA